MRENSRESAAKRGYDSRWQKARKAFLLTNPLCVMCKQAGRTTAASVVDHITPHKGDRQLFWDKDNWQAVCKPCHDRHKKVMESSGYQRGADASGMPLDANHHWRT